MAVSLFWTLLELLLLLTVYPFIFISRKRCWSNDYVITAAIFLSIESTPSPGIQCLAALLSGLSNWGRYWHSYLCVGTVLYRKYPWSSHYLFSFVFLSLESTALPVLSWAMFLSWMKASTSVLLIYFFQQKVLLVRLYFLLRITFCGFKRRPVHPDGCSYWDRLWRRFSSSPGE